MGNSDENELLASQQLRVDFETLRKNSADRAPKNLDAFFEFLRFASAFGTPAHRLSPVDAGRCRL